MATAAQIAANQRNAEKSTGPITPEGKARVAQNSVTFGLFARHDIPSAAHQPEDIAIREALLTCLAPANAVEELHAAEILRAARRLDRCAAAEASIAADPTSPGILDPRQSAIDRARAAAERSRDRAIAHLRRLQTERAWRDAHGPEMLAVGRVPLPPTVLTEQKEVFRKLPAKCLLDMVVAPPPGYHIAEYKRLMDEIDSRKPADPTPPEIAKQSQFAGAHESGTMAN